MSTKLKIRSEKTLSVEGFAITKAKNDGAIRYTIAYASPALIHEHDGCFTFPDHAMETLVGLLAAANAEQV